MKNKNAILSVKQQNYKINYAIYSDLFVFFTELMPKKHNL